jgi:hypothetical protein
VLLLRLAALERSLVFDHLVGLCAGALLLLVLVVLEQGLGQRQVGGRFGECRLQAQRLPVGGNCLGKLEQPHMAVALIEDAGALSSGARLASAAL